MYVMVYFDCGFCKTIGCKKVEICDEYVGDEAGGHNTHKYHIEEPGIPEGWINEVNCGKHSKAT